MKFMTTIDKVVGICRTKEEGEQGKLEENGTRPDRAGIVKLESAADGHNHQTFPASTARHQLPSHSKTAPAKTVDQTAPRLSMKVDIPEKPIRPIRRSPTVELVENKNYHPLGGPDYLKILAKYNLFGEDKNFGRVVCRFVNAGNVSNREPQIVKVEEYSAQGNQEFLAQVRIGNPPQGKSAILAMTHTVDLRLDLDTGSSDFWVFSTLLKSAELAKAKEKHAVFDHALSRTWHWPSRHWGGASNPLSFRREKLDWDLEYGDGSSAAGIVGFDDVEMGNIKITQQAVQLAKTFRGRQFREGTADGVLGLAFGHLNSVTPEPVRTPLESMIELNLLPEHLFTVSLGRECFFSFGFIDEATRAGRDIHWVDVDSRGGFWNFSSRVARVGNKILSRRGGAAIADTGSSIILTHPHIVWMIYKQIEGAVYDSRQPGWVYPKHAKVPEIAFSVGNDERCMIVINERNMHHSDLGQDMYFGAIQENPAYENGGLQFDIFGTPFFRQVYAIFDVKGCKFGVIIKDPSEMTPLHDSPISSQSLLDPEEAEDSFDGSILEEFPARRNSSLLTRMVDSPIRENMSEEIREEEEDATATNNSEGMSA
jgi:hypothetical protein